MGVRPRQRAGDLRQVCEALATASPHLLAGQGNAGVPGEPCALVVPAGAGLVAAAPVHPVLCMARWAAPGRRAAVRRMLDHYLRTAYSGYRVLDPARDPIRLPDACPDVIPEEIADCRQALAWFSAEHAVLLGAVRRAATDGFDTHTWRLAWALTTFLQRRMLAQDWVDTHIAALDAVRRLGDLAPVAVTRRDLGRAHLDLGRAYGTLGRHGDARAHLGHALELYREPGDLVGQAYTHRYLAILAELEGRFTGAADHARQSLRLFRAAGHRAGEARALNGLGWCLALRKDFDQALAHCRQALPLLSEIGDRDGQAHTWDSLGYGYHHLGDHRQAISCYQRAAGLFRELGDRYFEAGILVRLGETHRAAGDLDAARDTWESAMGIFDELGHPHGCRVRARLRGLRVS